MATKVNLKRVFRILANLPDLQSSASWTLKTLWIEHEPIAAACLAHPFVTGIADGSLPRQTFIHYVGQDAFFLEAFAKAYALGLAKSPDKAVMTRFKRLLDGALDEVGLHAAYAKRWGVDLTPQPNLATRAYTDFLLQVAALEPLANLCAAMTPCMRLYAWLGQRLTPRADQHSPYIEWVQTYAAPEFEELAVTLEDLLDELTDGSQAVRQRYGTAMSLELAFFDAAYDAGTTEHKP